MNKLVLVVLLLVLSARSFEFTCSDDTCTVSNLDTTIDGLYAFTFIPNGTDALFLNGAKGKLLDFSSLEAMPKLRQFQLERSMFEELALPAFQRPVMIKLKHVSVSNIRFHPDDKMLHEFRMCGTMFRNIPYTVLQLQHVVELEHSRSLMRQLQLGVLRSMKSLTNLNLSHNKIQTITTDVEGLCCAQLECVNLTGNLLMQFDFGMFMYMTKLKRLFLGDNRIAAITTTLSPSNNDRKSFCSWKSYYQKLFEADEEISKPQCKDYFAKLNTIVLYRNKLTVIDMSLFDWMNLLDDLDLARNPIKTIKILKDKVPLSLNLSALRGEAGYLHALSADLFTYL